MTAQMYNSCIHHPSLFSSHQSKPTKSPASPFLSLQMSSVGACLRHCRREKGQILCVNFDFLEFCLSSALLMGPLKLSQKGGRLCECGHVKCQHEGKKNKKQAKCEQFTSIQGEGKSLGTLSASGTFTLDSKVQERLLSPGKQEG